jgi:N-acetylmuramoyl-L-alanine amidase
LKRIVLAAGHRFDSRGAEANGASEYCLSRSIIRSAVEKIKLMPHIDVEIIVIENSKSLPHKIKQVNKIKPDLAVEIHWNACPTKSVHGSESFYAENGSETSKMASAEYVKIFEGVSGNRTRGSKPDTESQHPRLAWCRDTVCPAILVENEFLTFAGFESHYYELLSVTALVRFIKAMSYK